MSDSLQQDESHVAMEIHQPSTEVLADTNKKSENEKIAIPFFVVSRIALVFRRYGISIALNIFIIGIVCFLFLMQKYWMNYGNKDIGSIVEEKVIETMKKNISLDNTRINASNENEQAGRSLGNNKGEDASASMNSLDDMHIDRSKYIIEANRFYEQGCYENAAVFYEAGLNNSMPFLNEDFIMYRLGDCYLLSKRYEDALKVFHALTSDYINSTYQFKSRLKIGECYAKIGEFKKARKSLYTILALEGKCSSADDKLTVADSYFKIADYYMEEAKRFLNINTVGTSSTNQ
ncbi:MAG: hypothetical protein BROFUL_02996 [Candidatus Brocadia fulgida]|jgi:hypothetical protein|uniref:Tetratricopeptide repeat protein n=1 Tax=Candidatus Brocadia fulgida TaxID=380242 RepID=A0A0M2UUV4_9BACT|nr:MAG: hypothetical protein BROFUL_02996 [Candidatus Brocadia fulgida]